MNAQTLTQDTQEERGGDWLLNFPTPQDDGARAKLERRGARLLSDVDLLAALLEQSASKEAAQDAARRILAKVQGSIFMLSRWTISDFMAEGLTFSRAANLAAALELSRRFDERQELPTKISTARDVFDILEKEAQALDREKCWIFSLDIKNQILRLDEVSAGTATGSLFHSRDFLRPAVRCNASGVILAHNHPSGDATPSGDDHETTEKLNKAAKTLGIKLLDHIVVGRRNVGAYGKGFFSYAEAGRL